MLFRREFTTGLLLFNSKATDYYVNAAFRVKLLLILIAVAYHLVLFSWVSKWDDDRGKSLGLRLTGLASQFLWVDVIAASSMDRFRLSEAPELRYNV